MKKIDKELILNKDYALDTMNAGVLIITKDGHIAYANPKAVDILELTTNDTVFFKDVLSSPERTNDELIDLVINTISNGVSQESAVINYVSENNTHYTLLMHCTMMSDEEFVFTFSDETQLHEEMQKRRDSTSVLVAFFLIGCLWTILVSVWMRTGERIYVGNLTIIMEVIGLAALLVLLKLTSFTIKDFGLSTKNIGPTLKRAALRVIALFAAFVVIKLIMLKVYPAYFKSNKPFWDWGDVDYRLIKYLFTAFVQEFLARGGVQEALSRVFSGKHAKDYAIFLTSIYFASLHFQYGLAMMFGAGILSILLGYMYKEDGNIYGVTLFHYFFGKLADFLSLV